MADSRALLDRFFRVLNGLRNGALFIAIVAVVAMVLLIANTVQVAAFSRRRETGIMRLVGASNLYIQLPFILEGALAGLIGSAVASSTMFGAAWVLQTKAAPSFPFTNFVGYGTAFQISLILLVAGVGLSALTSFVALRRYMRGLALPQRPRCLPEPEGGAVHSRACTSALRAGPRVRGPSPSSPRPWPWRTARAS